MDSRRLLVVGSTLVSVLLASIPGAALAQVTQVTVRVDGLSCPFCAYSLEKRLKAVPGVHSPVISVKEGTVTLVPEREIAIDLHAIAPAVTKAGFTPRDVLVKGVGRLVEEAGAAVLRAGDGGPLFRLTASDSLLAVHRGEGLVMFIGTLLPSKGKRGTEGGPVPTLVLTSILPAAESGGAR